MSRGICGVALVHLGPLALAWLCSCGGSGNGSLAADSGPGPDGFVDEPTIDSLLAGVPGLRVIETETDAEGYRFFKLAVKIPLDPAQPDGDVFIQHMSLLHRDVDAPMVLAFTGYWDYIEDREVELTRLFSANQLIVENRFYGESHPNFDYWEDLASWQLLTLEHTADDIHAVVGMLRPIYRGRWISTGASKGGMTTVIHRRFYPDDLDGAVAYVAPLILGNPDPSFYAYIDSATPQACRDDVRVLNVAMINRFGELHSLVVGDPEISQVQADLIGGIDVALYSWLVTFEWQFWAYQGVSACSTLPAPDAPGSDLLAFIKQAGGLSSYENERQRLFVPFGYQSAAELGRPVTVGDYVGPAIESIAGTLNDLGVTPRSDFVPSVFADATLDPLVMPDIGDWVAADGSELLFLYGQYDPWSGHQFAPSDSTSTRVYIVPNGSHPSQLADLEAEDRAQASALIEGWLDSTANWNQLASATRRPTINPARLAPPPRFYTQPLAP